MDFVLLYCVFRYNAHSAPLPIQFFFYLFIGGTAAIANISIFMTLYHSGVAVTLAAPIAFLLASVVNYLLCIWLLFKHNAKWNSSAETLIFLTVVLVGCGLDLALTNFFIMVGVSSLGAKLSACGLGLIYNFLSRRYIVFPEPSSGPWNPQEAV